MWVNHGEAWLTIPFFKHPAGCLTYKLRRCFMKKFDAVKMMRDIRDKMVEKYLKNPELETEELEEIKKKYKILDTKKKIQPHPR